MNVKDPKYDKVKQVWLTYSETVRELSQDISHHGGMMAAGVDTADFNTHAVIVQDKLRKALHLIHKMEALDSLPYIMEGIP